MLRRFIQAAIATLLCSPAAQAQLTCASPADASLGATPTATLLSFPAFDVGGPCIGAQTIHHAVFHRFTATEDGWYSIHAVPTDTVAWRPRIAMLESCDQAGASIAYGQPIFGRHLCDQGNNDLRFMATVSVRLQAGQTRILVVGGDSTNDAGSAMLHVARIGSTLMEGAQPLAVGANAYTNAPRGPTLRLAGDTCGTSISSASRFSFVPPQTGTYRFGFCGTNSNEVAVSESPDLNTADTQYSYGGCPSNGGRLTAVLQAGKTYYLAAGYGIAYDSCATRNATVEFIPPCPADLNGDNIVNGADLGTMLVAWGTPDQDVTGDGTTDGVDLGILLASWGPCDPG